MSVDAWDQRQLCPDGGCVGVIGPEGTCKVCGRAAPNWGDPRRVGLIEPADADDEAAAAADGDAVIDPLAPEAPAVLGELAEWRERRLCSDGGCIGVIGADGRCKTCGKPADAASVAVDEADDAEEDDDLEAEAAEAEDAELEAAARDLAASLTSRDVDEVTADDDEPRKLCPDGACVGVIGPDGKCKLCGKEAA